MTISSGESGLSRAERYKTELRAAIAVLESGFEERFGYPIDPGANYVADAAEVASSESRIHLRRELAEFYSIIGKVTLPDVNVGYFVYSASTISESMQRLLPVRVESGQIRSDVVTFAANGGGELFALDVATGAVYYLPAGMIADGVYKGGGEGVRVVSPDLQGFLDELLSRVQEFAASGNWRGVDWLNGNDIRPASDPWSLASGRLCQVFTQLG